MPPYRYSFSPGQPTPSESRDSIEFSIWGYRFCAARSGLITDRPRPGASFRGRYLMSVLSTAGGDWAAGGAERWHGRLTFTPVPIPHPPSDIAHPWPMWSPHAAGATLCILLRLQMHHQCKILHPQYWYCNLNSFTQKQVKTVQTNRIAKRLHEFTLIALVAETSLKPTNLTWIYQTKNISSLAWKHCTQNYVANSLSLLCR